MDTENSSNTGNTIDYITLGICERCGTEMDSYGTCACEQYSKPIHAQARLKALDLFAGTGWGVACQRLGITESGVENMPEAVATRAANGMHTAYLDVWDGLALTADEHRAQHGGYGILIASPPCQTFSMAGHGAGRAALDEVLEAIDLHAYKDATALRDFGERHDMRTALVLAPLAYVWRDKPRLVAMEQVPTVLPVWEACAEVMRGWGYEVKVEVLNAEQYGVPQTRRRAILVARRGGPVHLPAPTHSRYYSRTPDKLDPGVLKWVSMAEALGWNRPGVTFTQNNKQAHQARRAMDQPAPTVTAGHDSGNRGFIDGDDFTIATPAEVAALQSYPVVFRSGNQAHAAHRTEDQPAPTIAFGHNANRVEWVPGDDPAGAGTRVTVEEAAALQSYERPFDWCGTKTKQFLQIGNAVPPLLAEAVLAALIGITPGR